MAMSRRRIECYHVSHTCFRLDVYQCRIQSMQSSMIDSVCNFRQYTLASYLYSTSYLRNGCMLLAARCVRSVRGVNIGGSGHKGGTGTGLKHLQAEVCGVDRVTRVMGFVGLRSRCCRLRVPTVHHALLPHVQLLNMRGLQLIGLIAIVVVLRVKRHGMPHRDVARY